VRLDSLKIEKDDEGNLVIKLDIEPSIANLTTLTTEGKEFDKNTKMNPVGIYEKK
jgi:hypothetical protein